MPKIFMKKIDMLNNVCPPTFPDGLDIKYLIIRPYIRHGKMQKLTMIKNTPIHVKK